MSCIQTNDIDVYYETGGQGPRVLLIRGSLAWSFLLDTLGDPAAGCD